MESEVPSSFAVRVYRPTAEQFERFTELMTKIDTECHAECFAKIIPPEQYRFESLKKRQNTTLNRVVKQEAAMIGNIFDLSYESVNKTTYKQFSESAKEHEKKFGIKTIEECEDFHWKNLIERSRIDPPNPTVFIPAYSIDNPITLFPRGVKLWNLNNFTKMESLIHGNNELKMPGILTPYLYLGMILSSFGLHLEDSDLCSINYLHRGKPKVWYGIPFSEHLKLHNLVEKLCQTMGNRDCNLYIRHKTLMIPPSVLEKNGIRFTRIIQNPGEYVVSLSGCYHMGFNCGFNEAEAVNFATNRWIQFYDNFKTCSCQYSELTNNVHSLLRPIFEVARAKSLATSEVQKKKQKPTSVQNSFNCGECPKEFTQKKNLLAHQRLKHAKTYEIYKCPHCRTTRNSAHNFKTHLRADHGIKIDDVEKFGKKVKKTAAGIAAEKEKKTVVRKMLTCDICGINLSGTFNFNRHKNTQHPN